MAGSVSGCGTGSVPRLAVQRHSSHLVVRNLLPKPRHHIPGGGDPTRANQSDGAVALPGTAGEIRCVARTLAGWRNATVAVDCESSCHTDRKSTRLNSSHT